ncbi:UNVERIFIED_CONTAM: hypothetical protein GTU68_017042, partial [Idotea baltica]|nr:hypothetical protein [Idotea baltica]
VGLTGGIGCGKSTAIDAFVELGIEIIDADQIARDIVEPDTAGLDQIADLFGSDILLNNGELDRAKLKKLIFSPTEEGEKALADLEKITHPIIRKEIENQIVTLENTNIPLLVEKDYTSMFDRIIVVDCLVEQQIERVQKRDGMDEAIIKKIIKQQSSREEKKAVATDILDNSGSIDELLAQVNLMHESFVSLSRQ